jgi:hypothetical protein
VTREQHAGGIDQEQPCQPELDDQPFRGDALKKGHD